MKTVLLLALLALLGACDAPGASDDGGSPWDNTGSARDGGSVRRDGGDAPLDGGVDPAADGGIPSDGGACDAGTGALAGRACAPDRTTSVAGASVSVDGVDCQGTPFHRQATAGADGRWSVEGIPAGDVVVTISLGSFVHTQTALVAAGTTSILSDDKTCFAPDAVKIAVVTGHGDHIEDLLTSLGLTPDIVVGRFSTDTPNPPAYAFLADLERLRQYQVLFLDCATLHHSGAVDLGAGAATIVANLKAFVAGGGSIYASDWAGVFLALAYPDKLVLRLFGADTGASPATSPFATNGLVGYAAQDIEAQVLDLSLAAYLGSSAVDVRFPVVSAGSDGGVSARHWALLAAARRNVSVAIAGAATPCTDSSCSAAGTALANVPLAVSFQPERDGGTVIFTSFHNISQPTEDVKKILQYLVFRL